MQPVETQGKKTEENVRLMAEEGTLCINADVEKKCGNHASATSKAEAYTNVYIKMAEGKICGEARKDFVTDYALYKTWFQELLRDAASNLAAIYVIDWDIIMSNYPYEATDMINNLYELYNKSIDLIRDNKVIVKGTI